MIDLSIVLSAPSDVDSLLRTLWGIAFRKPKGIVEVVLASERAEDAELLRMFSSAFYWKLALVADGDGNGQRVSGLSRGRLVIKQEGNCVPTFNAYRSMMEKPNCFGNVYDFPADALFYLDKYGTGIVPHSRDLTSWAPIYTDLFRDGTPPVFAGLGNIPCDGVFVRLPGKCSDLSERAIREVISK